MSQANLAAALRAFFIGTPQMQKERPVLVGNGMAGVPVEGRTNRYPVEVGNGRVFLGRLKQEEVA